MSAGRVAEAANPLRIDFKTLSVGSHPSDGLFAIENLRWKFMGRS
jgi:hypothetical protein